MDFKQKVYDHCMALLDERINRARLAMAAAQEAANGEDKSSAGDKYETSRAMGHLDRDMNAKQMAEALKEKQTLLKINPGVVSTLIVAGSLVETADRTYFIGAGLGQVTVDGKAVTALSPAAPLTKLMLGKKVKETFAFNKAAVVISRIL